MEVRRTQVYSPYQELHQTNCPPVSGCPVVVVWEVTWAALLPKTLLAKFS